MQWFNSKQTKNRNSFQPKITKIPTELLIECFLYLDYFDQLVIGRVCSDWRKIHHQELINKPVICIDGKDQVLNHDYLGKSRHCRTIIRNLFRKRVVEWIVSNINYWRVEKEFSPQQTAEKNRQTLEVDIGQYEVLSQFSSVFGDVKELQRSRYGTSSVKLSGKSSAWDFFSSVFGYSKQNVKVEKPSQKEDKIGPIKVAMFGWEISRVCHLMYSDPKSKMKYLVGTDFETVNYHSTRSLTHYTYLLFSNAGSDKFIGVTKAYFTGSHFAVLLFDSKNSLEYLAHFEPLLCDNIELLIVQMKHANGKPVKQEEAEQFIYSVFGEAAYMEIDVENNPESVNSILTYTTLLSDVLMGCNLKDTRTSSNVQ